MASSNRHWPSMFRSNPAARAACDLLHQPDMNNLHSKPSLISSGIDQESGRSPGETKPRWNPRPEQIRILEGIFNSGVVNPPRDEIRRIRLRLQEYGHVADANVFYWFQNRKSRTKNKLRAAQAAAQGQHPAGRSALARAPALPVTPPRRFLAPVGTLQAPTSSSSSSSDRSSGSSRSVTMKPASMASSVVASQAMLPPSAATTLGLFAPPRSACQLYCLQRDPMPMPTPAPYVRELVTATPESPPPPLLLQWPPQSQYLPATELGGVLGSHAHASVSPGVHLGGLCSNDVALGQHEIVDMTCCSNSKTGLGGGQFFVDTTTGSTADPPSHRTDAVSAVFTEDEKARLGLLHYSLGAVTAATAAPVHAAAADVNAAAVLPCASPSNNAATSSAFTDQLQGLLDAGLLMGGGAPAMVVVVAAARPEAGVQWYSVPAMTRLDVGLFGEAAVLLRHTGEPVPLDGAGVTAEPLQHGAVYYVLV